MATESVCIPFDIPVSHTEHSSSPGAKISPPPGCPTLLSGRVLTNSVRLRLGSSLLLCQISVSHQLLFSNMAAKSVLPAPMFCHLATAQPGTMADGCWGGGSSTSIYCLVPGWFLQEPEGQQEPEGATRRLLLWVLRQQKLRKETPACSSALRP